jgi:hypothetical protein
MLASGGVTLAIVLVLLARGASAEPETYSSVSCFAELTGIAQIGAIREVRNAVDFARNSMSSLTIS